MIAQPKIPLAIMVADIVGTLAAGIGVADAIAGIKLVPEEYRFPYYNWILTVVGFLLISLHSIYVIKAFRAQSPPADAAPRSAANGRRLKR